MQKPDEEKKSLTDKEIKECKDKVFKRCLELIEKGGEEANSKPHNSNNEEDERYKDQEYNFYKENPNDTIWWVDNPDVVGEHLFSFDKKEVFYLFGDYPWKLTKEQKEIFDKENPFWADFFRDRQ